MTGLDAPHCHYAAPKVPASWRERMFGVEEFIYPWFHASGSGSGAVGDNIGFG